VEDTEAAQEVAAVKRPKKPSEVAMENFAFALAKKSKLYFNLNLIFL